MRIGSLIFSTDQGLGYLAKDFYDHGVLTDVLVLRHGKRPDHLEWYPNQPVLSDVHDKVTTQAFCQRMDAMLFFETPFDWSLLNFCREVGVKAFLMPMHECTPDPLPALPDVFLCPSDLDHQCFNFGGPHGLWKTHRINVPVPDWVQWRKREWAEVFVHNAGNGGLRGRNGTAELLAALPLCRNRPKVVIHSQVPLPSDDIPKDVIVRIGNLPREALYEGDVFVFPEKFNGLSLPLQEAHAAGMLVMGSDRFPMNQWLPQEPLIRVNRYDRRSVAGFLRQFDEAVIRPFDIAASLDNWAGRDISNFSEAGKRWASANSWEMLKPKYMEVLCASST